MNEDCNKVWLKMHSVGLLQEKVPVRWTFHEVNLANAFIGQVAKNKTTVDVTC